MTPYQELRLIAAGIELGTSERIVCPRCDGGSTHETCLQITKDELGNVGWFCYRASCGFRGNTGISWADNDLKLKAQKTHPFTYDIVPCPFDKRKDFEDKFGFWPTSTSFIGDPLKWTTALGGRYLQPFMGPEYQLRGYVARVFDGSSDKKAIAYPEVDDEPFIHWAFTKHYSDTKLYVIVEDWVSAQKVKENNAHAIALCGTHIDYTRAMEISRVAKDNVVLVCLDKDATALAFRHVKKYNGVFSRLLIRPLEQDIKDMPAEDIREIIRYGNTFTGSSN